MMRHLLPLFVTMTLGSLTPCWGASSWDLGDHVRMNLEGTSMHINRISDTPVRQEKWCGYVLKLSYGLGVAQLFKTGMEFRLLGAADYKSYRATPLQYGMTFSELDQKEMVHALRLSLHF